MASRSGYKSLPDSAAEEDAQTADNAEQPQQVAAGNAARASSRPEAPGKGENPPAEVAGEGSGGSAGGGGGGGGSKASPTAELEKKDPAASSADGGGGGELPTAQGIFVGDPVSQSGYSHAPPPARATVITSAPASYEHVAAAAVAAGGGRGIAVPSGGGGQHTVIVMNAPPAGHHFGEWGRQPQAFVCRACGFTGLSLTATDPCSNMPILAAACCCLVGCWPCSFVPFLIPELRDTVHRCPNCHISVGRSRQFN
ncbi:unnamed protein product [Ectocarpus fasciculatus]